ncbi:hypothetical protein HK096_008335, partial [Nowakowskiella sp. JEL0078]
PTKNIEAQSSYLQTILRLHIVATTIPYPANRTLLHAFTHLLSTHITLNPMPYLEELLYNATNLLLPSPPTHSTFLIAATLQKTNRHSLWWVKIPPPDRIAAVYAITAFVMRLLPTVETIPVIGLFAAGVVLRFDEMEGIASRGRESVVAGMCGAWLRKTWVDPSVWPLVANVIGILGERKNISQGLAPVRESNDMSSRRNSLYSGVALPSIGSSSTSFPSIESEGDDKINTAEECNCIFGGVLKHVFEAQLEMIQVFTTECAQIDRCKTAYTGEIKISSNSIDRISKSANNLDDG